MEHQAYKQSRVAEVEELQRDALARQLAVEELEQEAFMTAGIESVVHSQAPQTKQIVRYARQVIDQESGDDSPGPREENPLVVARLAKAREDNQKLFEIVSTLETQLSNSRHENEFIDNAAKRLSLDLIQLKQEKAEEAGKYANPQESAETLELRSQMDVVKKETKQNNDKIDELKAKLSVIQHEKMEIAKELASTEVLLLQSPAIFHRKPEKKKEKTEPEKPKHLSNANVLQGLYDMIKALETEVKLLKENNHKLETDNRCSQLEVDYVNKTIQSLKASGALKEESMSEVFSSNKVNGAEAKLINEEINDIDIETYELAQKAAEEKIKMDIELKSKKVEELRRNILPNLEAQLRHKAIIISDLERSTFAQSQTKEITIEQEHVQEHKKAGLMRQYDFVEMDNHLKSEEILA